MKGVLWLVTVAVAWWFPQGGAPAVPGECQSACGNVNIYYPFGLETNCVRSADFLLNCANNIEGSGVQLLSGNLAIHKISVGDSTLVVSLPEAYECYNQNGTLEKNSSVAIDLSSNPRYRFSETQNKLTVLGCDTLASVANSKGTFGSGCISYCSDNVNITKETTCSGQGCCQASIPKGLRTLNISISPTDPNRLDSQLNRCAQAFVVDNNSFNISNWTLPSFEDVGNTPSLVLDWMVEPDVTCEEAQLNKSSYACGGNTTCEDFRPGYRCVCNRGYEGNPYNRKVGCTDINECKNPKKYPCHGKCRNKLGTYDCRCRAGKKGKGKERCKVSPWGVAVPVLAVSFFGMTMTASISFTMRVRLRRINFKRNGGEFFQQHKVRIFTELELAKATNNYDDRNKLSNSNFGSVHKGTLEEHKDTVVVVKKPKDVDKSLLNTEFQSELEILMNIRCKNVVKLKGICLETKIPSLVYEYVPNGTLLEHIHPTESTRFKSPTILNSWKSRFKIAAEAALALDYMHSSIQPLIVHGNIKSANILLDQKYSAKVSDFGTSVLISPEHRHIVATQKKNSLGYIDPEYLITGELTAQSDVYSFGVVLVELLTRKKLNATEPKKSPSDFEDTTSSMKRDTEPNKSITTIHRFISSVRKMRAMKRDTRESLANFEDTTSFVKRDTRESLADFEDTTSSVRRDTLESLADFEDTTSFVRRDAGESLSDFEDTTSSVKRDTSDPLSDVIDFEGASEDEVEKVRSIAEIAERCLEQSGAKRPTMSEVAAQLVSINPSSKVEEENEDLEEENEDRDPEKVSCLEEVTSSCLSCLGLD